MSDIQWSPEGEKLFGQLIEALPEQMRNLAKPQLIDFLKVKSGGEPVTSEMITGMVEDLPEPQKGMLAQALANISDTDDDSIDTDAVEKIIEKYPAGEEALIAMLFLCCSGIIRLDSPRPRDTVEDAGDANV